MAKKRPLFTPIPETLQNLDELLRREVAHLDEEKERSRQGSFLKRTFGSHDAEHAVEKRVAVLRHQRSVLTGMLQALQEKRGLLPDAADKKVQLLKETRRRIKEIKAKKKTAAVAMTEIRREARVASEGAGKTWLGLYDSSLAADERRGIRDAKERALRPYEDAKLTLDREVLALEQLAIWLENFE